MKQNTQESEAISFFKNINMFLINKRNKKDLLDLIFLCCLIGILICMFTLSNCLAFFFLTGAVSYIYLLLRCTKTFQRPKVFVSNLDTIKNINNKCFNFNKYRTYYKMILSKMIQGEHLQKILEIIHNIKHLDTYNGSDKQNIIDELNILHKMLINTKYSGVHIYILLTGSEKFNNINNFIHLCKKAKNKEDLEKEYIQELKLFEDFYKSLSNQNILIGEQQKPNIQLYNPIPQNNILNEYLRLQDVIQHNKKEINQFIMQFS